MDTFFVDIYEAENLTFLTWPLPDLHYKLLKIASHDTMNAVIEFLGKVDKETYFAWSICDLKILVTFCDLALPFKCTMYRVSTLIVS